MRSRRYHVSSDRRLKENCSRQELADFADALFISDCGPAERWQHSGRVLEVTDSAGVVASRCVEECVLDILHLQQHITKQQLRAALRFKDDFLNADLGPHLVGSYNPARVSSSYYAGCDDRTDAQEESYRLWRGAVAEIGDMLCDCVITVVCHDIPPCPSHILPLQIGLIRLARYYSIPVLDDDVDQTAAWEIAVGGAGRGETHRLTRLLH